MEITRSAGEKCIFDHVDGLSEGVDLIRIIAQVVGGYIYIYCIHRIYIYTCRIHICIYIYDLYIHFHRNLCDGQIYILVAQPASRFMGDCRLLEMVGVSMIFPATLGMGKLKRDCNATGNRPLF